EKRRVEGRGDLRWVRALDTACSAVDEVERGNRFQRGAAILAGEIAPERQRDPRGVAEAPCGGELASRAGEALEHACELGELRRALGRSERGAPVLLAANHRAFAGDP